MNQPEGVNSSPSSYVIMMMMRITDRKSLGITTMVLIIKINEQPSSKRCLMLYKYQHQFLCGISLSASSPRATWLMLLLTLPVAMGNAWLKADSSERSRVQTVASSSRDSEGALCGRSLHSSFLDPSVLLLLRNFSSFGTRSSRHTDPSLFPQQGDLL